MTSAFKRDAKIKKQPETTKKFPPLFLLYFRGMRNVLVVLAGWMLLFFSGLTGGKTAKKSSPAAPPGTVFLKEGLYIDVFPISNRDYLEFLDFCKSADWEKCFSDENKIPQFGFTWDSLAKLLHFCPSTRKFLQRFEPADTVIEIFSKDVMHKKITNPFRYKEYNLYPVVNISYEQAVKFCEWRSKLVMCRMAIECKTAEERAKKHYKKIKFRLPSKEEWELALKTFCSGQKPGKRIFAEGKPLTLVNGNNKKFTFLSFSIAEMLSEKGKCAGLSYKDIALSDIYLAQNYEGPQPWLGFRCVCEAEK